MLGCLAVAAGYYASGRLGLLLAIPPGYATAVWPASGIAFAAILLGGYRLWPGIWLGSFLINVWTGLDTSSAARLAASLPVPSLIALGAAAQACLGVALVRRFVGYSNLLAQEFDVVPILFLAGPASCMLNSALGVGVLFAHGAVPADGLLFNWWTWWVGDSIGVLVFAPLVLVWATRPAQRWRRLQVLTTLPLVVVFALVVWLFVYVSGREQARINATFDGWSKEFSERVARDVDTDIDVLYSIESFYASSETVERREFETFAARLLAHVDGMQGLSWTPVVGNAERAAVEAAARSSGLAGFEIRELDAGGNLVRAGARDFYVPVEYMVPMTGNDRALGFDIASEALRRDALERARDSGAPAATARLVLVQEKHDRAGTLILLPVFKRGAPHDTPGERAANLAGFAAAVFRVDDMLAGAIERVGAEGIDVRVFDVSEPGPPLLLHGAEARPAGDAAFSRDVDIRFADRHWRAELRLPASYLAAHRSWQTWTLLAAGMLFTGLLGVFLLVTAGRNLRVEALVDERTAELQRVNRELIHAVARSEQLEGDARHRAELLAASNRELEQFAYAVSHDLQAPLRNIDAFSSLLEKRHGAKLDGEAHEFLGFIRGCAGDMRRLIEDLLQLSRVNAQRAEIASTSSAEALRAALGQLRSDIDAAGARIDSGRLPAVEGDARMLVQLFQNLVSNAVKFRRPGVAPVVSVGAEPRDGEWLFAVRDNGIGIAPQNAGKLFQVFKRLHTTEQYPGTGIGLALCRKIVQLHGGRIWLESVPGEGTTFYFTLPIHPAGPAAATRSPRETAVA